MGLFARFPNSLSLVAAGSMRQPATRPRGCLDSCEPAPCAKSRPPQVRFSGGAFSAPTSTSEASNFGPNQQKPPIYQNMKTHLPSPELTRRDFLRRTAKGAALGALFAGLPKGWVGTAYASDAPETNAMNFGMIALTDCSPIVIAHEKGLFKKYGIDSVVTKGANWA